MQNSSGTKHRFHFSQSSDFSSLASYVIPAVTTCGDANLQIYTNSYSHAIEEIIKWMSDPTSRQGDLIVSLDLVAGFEFTIIMDLTGGDPGVTTRTLANVIQIYYNPILDMEWAIQNILTPGHDCDTVMEWNPSREKIPNDISYLIGEISTHLPQLVY